ncbi:asparaginase [Gracilibacillus sp. YIM 98692]|uniref:asparaginase n=1 Tax=Gracilibacillus sp. YIM 98692 TaxID=2663532 RepID=UPI0013D080E3|nr:asparaginase [Gracilibacillus sp. YIM 98692]
MNFKVLVEESRNSILENIHIGHIYGVTKDHQKTFQVGNRKHLTLLRSALKPFQAIPAIYHRVPEAFQLTKKETALLMASHRGEDFHVEQLIQLMRKIGVTEDDLLCSPTYPLNPDARDELMRQNKPKRQIYHNCSGKHLGMIALAKVLKADIRHYDNLNHPVQEEIRKFISILADQPISNSKNIAVDGCGTPVYAFPLSLIAQLYLNFIFTSSFEDQKLQETLFTISQLMNEHAEMISGTSAICSILLQDPNIFAKGGAQGVYCFVLKKEGIAFSLKVLNGSEEVWPLIVAEILRQINYGNEQTIQKLDSLTSQLIVNDNKKVVGQKKTVFKLKVKKR